MSSSSAAAEPSGCGAGMTAAGPAAARLAACCLIVCAACSPDPRTRHSGGAASKGPEGSDDAGLTADAGWQDAAGDALGGEEAGPAEDAGWSDDAATSADSGGPEEEPFDPSTPIASLHFAPPEPWADPIADYLEIGSANAWTFLRGIHDLIVWQDRLYLGYGDANANLGRVVPIEVRAFGAPRPDTLAAEFRTDEEQIDSYRILGEDLFIPGIDAVEDAWLGNVYYRRPGEGEGWVKSRTVQEGVHVHDVAEHGGRVFAVGSGAAPEEWNAGRIFAHLWVSDDRGASFDILERVESGGEGRDARFIRLLPMADGLWCFGYRAGAQGIDELIPARWDGERLEPMPAGHPLERLFITETEAVAPDFGLLRGVDAGATPLRQGVWRLSPGGQVTALTRFAGMTVTDVYLHRPSGELLVQAWDGDDYSDPEAGFRTSWSVRLLACPVADPEDCTELCAFTSDVPPASIAYWRGSIYYGTDQGQVWRSVGSRE